MAGGRKLLPGCLVLVAIIGSAEASATTIVPSTRADEPGLDPDNGNCTLREAVESADRDVSEDACRRGDGADVIKLRRGTYELSVPGAETPGNAEADNALGDLDLALEGSSPLKIVGHKRGTTVDGGDYDRVFHVFSAGLVTFQGLTVTNGTTVNRGGGIDVFEDAAARFLRTTIVDNSAFADGGVSIREGAKATFSRATVRDNTVGPSNVGGGIGVFGRAKLVRTEVASNGAGTGGGIFVYGEVGGDPPGVVNLRQSRVARNDAAFGGGGIASGTGASVKLSESSVERNDAGTNGGGINNDRGDLVVTASTIARNRANERGGGISLSGDPSNPISLRMTNSTVSGNVADQDEGGGAGEGGGMFAGAYGEKLIESSTVTGNQADRGGGIAGAFVSGPAPVMLKGTIVAHNTALNPTPVNGPDCLFLGPDSGQSLGHNLIGDANGCPIDSLGSDLEGNAGLEPLRQNGGPTKTHALKRSSRAVDSGPNDAPNKDQRGVTRRDPDIGAFERE